PEFESYWNPLTHMEGSHAADSPYTEMKIDRIRRNIALMLRWKVLAKCHVRNATDGDRCAKDQSKRRCHWIPFLSSRLGCNYRHPCLPIVPKTGNPATHFSGVVLFLSSKADAGGRKSFMLKIFICSPGFATERMSAT